MEQKPIWIDSHAHITLSSLWEKKEKLLEEAKLASLQAIINIGTDRETTERALLLQEEYPFIYTAGATTPHDVEKEGKELFPFFADLARKKKLIAIGETGLDYYYEHAPKQMQQDFLKRYFALANETNLPMIIHCRDAFDDFFRIADSHYPNKEQQLVLHCFTGTLDEAKEVIKRGWFISFSGILTFKKSASLREVAKQMPLNQVVIETDSPYLAPEGMRGRVNTPANVVAVGKTLAEITDRSVEEIAQITSDNAKKLFSLPN